jgi:hypothetical protein
LLINQEKAISNLVVIMPIDPEDAHPTNGCASNRWEEQ